MSGNRFRISCGSGAENSSFFPVRVGKAQIDGMKRLTVDQTVVRAVEKIPGSGARWLSYGRGSGAFFRFPAGDG